MPALVNVHVHIGYEGYSTWQASNHTPANVLDHLQRSAFYGTAATTSVGTSPLEQMRQVQADQRAGKLPPAARLLFLPGFAPPNGGPDAVLRVATNELKVVNEVTTPAEARAAVQRLAAQKVRHLKAWFDDRRGSYPKLTADTYLAILDEAHQQQMTLHTHAIDLADQKMVVKAGTDVLVHMVQREPLDDEYLAIVREKKPYWATVIGLGDPTEVCNADPFFEQAMPDPVIKTIRATMERRPLAPSCGPPNPNAAAREKQMAINFPQMLKAGARVVLATDTGIQPGHTFGSGEHVEMARWVQLGMSPGRGDCRRHQPAGRADGPDRPGLAGGREAGQLHRARRQPARRTSGTRGRSPRSISTAPGSIARRCRRSSSASASEPTGRAAARPWNAGRIDCRAARLRDGLARRLTLSTDDRPRLSVLCLRQRRFSHG